MVSKESFIDGVTAVAGSVISYRTGGTGTDGTCDCIGLVIGGLRKAGYAWQGLYGTNWAVRNAVDDLRAVDDASELRVGEVVFKYREFDDPRYSLPDRYKNDTDINDYYHVGVVLSVDPLDIVHCTDAVPAIRHDSKLGTWTWAAQLMAVDYGKRETKPAAAAYTAVVATQNDPLRVRESPKTGKVIGKIPKGQTVSVLRDTGDGWPFVQRDVLCGYASSEYLQKVDVAENATTTQGSSSEIPNSSDIVIIDDAGNTFHPKGGFRVLIGPVD